MNTLIKDTLKTLTIATISVALVVTVVGAWTGPTAAPPGNNVPAPINVGNTDQSKNAAIGATMFEDHNDPSFVVNPNGASLLNTITTHSGSYALFAKNAAGVDNSAVKTPAGSLNVNDMYVRSISKWVSEIGAVTLNVPANCEMIESDADGNLLCADPPPSPYTTPEYSMLGGSGANCQTHTVTGLPPGGTRIRENVRWYDHGWYSSGVTKTFGGGTSHTSNTWCIHQGGYIHYIVYFD